MLKAIFHESNISSKPPFRVRQSVATDNNGRYFPRIAGGKLNGISIFRQETAKEPHPSLNFIHTERPHWATKPAQSKPTTDFSKPYFSIKTTTYRPISISSQADHRPNFISKPNTWSLSTKTSTTTVRPTYMKQPSTRYEICFRIVSFTADMHI